MNEPDDLLRAHFQRERTRDENRAPSFAAMSGRAREKAVAGEANTRCAAWLWLAPATTAVVFAVLVLHPSPPPAHDYSERIAALLDELDAPVFAQAALPSDLLPSAFSPP